MSVISDMLARGLSVLATAKSESVAYRPGISGGFTALTGFVLIQQRVAAPIFDDAQEQEEQRLSATLKGPLSPVLFRGYQIQDTVTGLIWAVQSNKTDVQQVCQLELVKVTQFTPNRGGAA